MKAMNTTADVLLLSQCSHSAEGNYHDGWDQSQVIGQGVASHCVIVQPL